MNMENPLNLPPGFVVNQKLFLKLSTLKLGTLECLVSRSLAFYSKLIPSYMSVTQLFTVFYALFPQTKLNHMKGHAWLQAEQILLKVK